MRSCGAEGKPGGGHRTGITVSEAVAAGHEDLATPRTRTGETHSEAEEPPRIAGAAARWLQRRRDAGGAMLA
jgi:hypothetical protein